MSVELLMILYDFWVRACRLEYHRERTCYPEFIDIGGES